MQMFEYANLDWISTDVDPIVVQNFWYTPLVETDDVKAYYLLVEQTNNGAAVEDIELEVTHNGTVDTLTIVGAISGTIYYAVYDVAGVITFSTSVRQVISLDLDQSAPMETKSMMIRARQTTAVDIVAAQIEVNMVYATLEAT